MNSRLLSLEAENFMGYEYFRVDFDDTNIISLKGYNSSGKTTVLRALGVINSDMWTMKQSKFIRYGKNMFRISENFSDGVRIVREKYASGKSAYIMYKDGKEIFSTIQNGVYTPFKEVPQTIKRYLNLIDDTSINLHLRRGRDGLLLVDTTGKENYQFLSSALKAEEINNASVMLKQDRLEVKSDVTALQYEIESNRKSVKTDVAVTTKVVEHLETVDADLSLNQDKKDRLDKLFDLIKSYNQIKPSVSLNAVDGSKVAKLSKLFKTISDFNKIKVTSSLDRVSIEKASRLSSILKGVGEFNKKKPLPTLNAVSLDAFNLINKIGQGLASLNQIESAIQSNNSKIDEYRDQVNQIETLLKENSVNVFRCKNCGELQAVGEEHSHQLQ